MSTAKTSRGKSWAGGYIYEGRRRRAYVIHRMVNGVQYEVSTKCSTEAAAMLALQRFEEDPAQFVSVPTVDVADQGPKPIHLNIDLCTRYLDACAKPDSPKYWRSKKKLIAWWLVQLAGKDLRRLDLSADVLPFVPLEAPSRGPKIAVLKHLFSWMADVQGGNVIAPSENAMLGLKMPQADPVQRTRPKTFSARNLARALALLRKMGKADHADALTVLAETGWHVTELDRLARGVAGTGIQVLPAGRKAQKGSVVLLTLHKVGSAPHRTEVEPRVAAAARRLISRGGVPANLTPVLVEVNEALKLEPQDWVMPGRARHSVATAAVDAGESVQVVAEFLGHRSSATTRRFYSTLATPKKVQGMLK